MRGGGREDLPDCACSFAHKLCISAVENNEHIPVITKCPNSDHLFSHSHILT